MIHLEIMTLKRRLFFKWNHGYTILLKTGELKHGANGLSQTQINI